MEKTISEDMEEFMAYLKTLSNAQVQGCYDKERDAKRLHFAVLARAEAEKRGIELTR
jgi:hypothetical protein